MKTKNSIAGLSIGVAVMLGLHAQAATRLCSIYVASIAELQKDIAIGMEAYQMPFLGLLPMLITANLPGGALINNQKPLAFHLLDMGGNKTDVVMEASPAGAVDAFMQALMDDDARQAGLPAPENGVIHLGKQIAAKVVDGRVLIVKGADNPTLSLQAGVEKLSEPPAIPGNLRLTVEPAALEPRLKVLTLDFPAMGGANGANQTANKQMAQYYGNYLAQLAVLHIGVDVKKEGLFLRTRTLPKKGSALFAMQAAAKPVNARQLALLKKGALYNNASGGTTLPGEMQKQFSSFYTALLQASLPPDAIDKQSEQQLQQMLALQDVPAAISISQPTPDGAIRMTGLWWPKDPTAFFATLTEDGDATLAAQMLAATGLKPTKPVLSENHGAKVATWPLEFDEALIENTMRARIPAEMAPERAATMLNNNMENLRKILAYLKGAYAYGIKGENIYFGLGEGDIIGEVIEITEKGSPTAADWILAALSPSGEPLTVGTLALSRLVSLIMANNPLTTDAAKAINPGEGLSYATWRVDDETLSALLLPAGEIKALTAMITTMQTNDNARRGGNRGGRREKPPARPPIPENF